MIKDIELVDTDKNVTVTIDNEVDKLPIKSIIKLPTYILLNSPIDTSLYNNIEINATLCYIDDKDDDKVETELDINNITAFQIPNNKVIRKIDIDGTVIIKIYNDEKTYYEETVSFTNGNIIQSIQNAFSIGEYKCDIIYYGNKYFEECTLPIVFNINRRLAKCIFDKTSFSGELKETLSIKGVLKDAETNIAITDSILNFTFDGKSFSTLTREDGSFIINPVIPDANILHCNQLIIDEDNIVVEMGEPYEEQYDEELRDEDGNIVFKHSIEELSEEIEQTQDIIYSEEIVQEDTQSTSYLINFSLNNSYYLSNTSIIITVTKAPTFVTITAGEYDEKVKKVNFNGYIGATVLNILENAHYGKVEIYFPDFGYTHNLVNIDASGKFSTNIDMADVYSFYNNTDIDKLEIYQGYNNIYDTSIIITDDSEVNVKKGDSIIIETNVKTITNEIVTDGMVRYYLYYEDNESPVYEYWGELDNIGISSFSFNTSRSGDYKLKTEYVGLFGYKNSEKIISIQVSD